MLRLYKKILLLIIFKIILSIFSTNPKNKFYYLRQSFLNNLYNKTRLNLTHINILFLKGKSRTGNFFISINNAIIFCELVGCKKLIIEFNKKIFIEHPIFYRKYHLSIEPNQTVNFKDNNNVNMNIHFFYFLNKNILGEVNRFNIFKNEILNNIPKMKTNPKDLYIYIRGGDIFYNYKRSIRSYAQPPLCFYKKILEQFKFRKVYIISQDKLNPVISLLIENYTFIIYKSNKLKIDISYLAYSTNIVSAKSSFIVSIIKINDKLKNLWEYDFYKLSERYLHLHYSVYTFPFKYTIYKMNPSKKYKKSMYPWINSIQQKMMMIKEKCINKFYIIRPR